MKPKLKAYIETLGNAGNIYTPPGTRPWAIGIRGELRSALHDIKFTAQQLKAWHELMKKHQGYKQLVGKNGLPFNSYEDFCQEPPPFGLGCDPEEIEQLIKQSEELP